MAASVGKTTDVDRAICRIVEETSACETLKYFGPGCLVKFESTKFLNSVGTPESNYFLVASSQVLRKVLLGTLEKKSELSVTMVAEFQDLKFGGKLERKPLNELYSSLEDDVFECGGITYVALTKLRASGFRKSTLLSRALEGVSSLTTSDQLQCIVLCNERRINRDNRDFDELSTKAYDLLQFDSILARTCDGEPLGSIIVTRDAKFGGVLNFIKTQPAPAFVKRGFSTEFANGKQSPTENSYRSSHFNSLANKAEVEQDFKGEVLVVDIPPGNGSKETPASVEPEQRTHANNSDKEPSVQDPEEQLRNLYDDLRVQATNNENDSSVQDPAEHLKDQDDNASVHRRNNDGTLAEAPGGETDDDRADPNNVLRQGRSGDGSHQDQVSEQRGRLPGRRRSRQRSSGESAAPQSAANQSENTDVSETETSQQETLRDSNPNIVQQQYANEARTRRGSAGKTKNEGATNCNVTIYRSSGTVMIGNRNSLTIRSRPKYERNGNTVQQQYDNKARTRKGSADNTETTENEDASNYDVTIEENSGSVVLGHDNSVTEYDEA